jgi:hypothetical protein
MVVYHRLAILVKSEPAPPLVVSAVLRFANLVTLISPITSTGVSLLMFVLSRLTIYVDHNTWLHRCCHRAGVVAADQATPLVKPIIHRVSLL